jgi:5-methylcytosine-specific restriction protein A
MARAIEEWVELDHDKPIPRRVKIRVADRADYRCKNCGVRIYRGGQIDHVRALINGGEHRESNLQLLCRNCHAAKSNRDISEKSKIYQTKKRMAPVVREQSRWSKQYHALKAKGFNPWGRKP